MRSLMWSLVFLCLLAGPALAGEAVGQFTATSGEVALESGGAAAPAAALARVREGDLVRLGPGASASLAYFANDREETWSGPGSFLVGREGGQGQNGLAPTAVAAESTAGTAPSGVSKEDLGKGGQLMIRGVKKPAPASQ